MSLIESVNSNNYSQCRCISRAQTMSLRAGRKVRLFHRCKRINLDLIQRKTNLFLADFEHSEILPSLVKINER